MSPNPNPPPAPTTVHGLVALQAALRPRTVAVRTMDGQRLTYAELHERASAFARALRARGVGPGQFVVVRMRRTPDFVVALLGVMGAGAAAVAVDPAWPAARVQHIADASTAHLLTDDPDNIAFPARPAPGRQRLQPLALPATGAPALPDTGPGDPCAVFFTSGSTGEPKGTVAPHRAVVCRFVGTTYADFGPGRTVLQAAPVCWDAMTIELWAVLMNGGTSLLLDDGEVVSPELLRRLVASAGLDTLWLTAALFNAVVDDDPDCFHGVRQVLTGGEKLSPDHVQRFRAAHPGVRLVNGYGPVETTVFATTRIIGDDDAERYGQIPLGTPLPATPVRVLAPDGTPCAPGETGEICIGGDGVALGYLSDPELTARRFVTAPDGERLYRSGDMGRWHPDGPLLYEGRRDRQVKIRGQRVEPAELERFLEGIPGVHQAAVTVIRDPAGGAATGLAAHCLTTAADGDGLTADELHARCAAELPSYARPRQILLHEAFPRTAAGKTDLRALERLATADTASASASAASGEEEHALDPPPVFGRGDPHLASLVRACLAEAGGLLGRELGPDDDLFRCGADSMVVMRLVSRLSRRAGVRVPLEGVYRGRTPRAIASLATPDASATPTEQGEAVQVKDSRADLWMAEQLNPGDPALLLFSSFDIRPAIDPPALRAALDRLAARHPALRTGFRLRGAEVHAEPLATAIPIHTDAPAPPPGEGEFPPPWEWLTPFDLANDPPVRCYLSPVPGGSNLTLVMHHIAYDGWSEHVFLTELGAAYSDADADPDPGLDPGRATDAHPPVPAGDELAAARAHWRRRLAGTHSLDLPPGRDAAPRFAELRMTLPAPEVTRLREAAGASDGDADGDPHTTALAWYGRALHALTGTGRFAVGSYFAGRETAPEDAIGYYVRPVPVIVEPGAPLDAVAAAARRDWLDAIGRPALPLSELAELAPRPARYGLTPVFQAALTFQNAPEAQLRLPAHAVTRRDVRPAAAPLPLALQIWPAPDGGWDVRLQCDPTVIADAVLPALADRLSEQLRSLPALSPAHGR
jgi:mycobactin peptide synthetase MbtE